VSASCNARPKIRCYCCFPLYSVGLLDGVKAVAEADQDVDLSVCVVMTVPFSAQNRRFVVDRPLTSVMKVYHHHRNIAHDS
jgi:hypothetical protein